MMRIKMHHAIYAHDQPGAYCFKVFGSNIVVRVKGQSSCFCFKYVLFHDPDSRTDDLYVCVERRCQTCQKHP